MVKPFMAFNDPLLKTQQVAEALRVSGSTIKRWVDSGALTASRTLGRHRLIPLSEALSFARRQGLSVEGLEVYSVPVSAGNPELRVVDDRLRAEFLEALRDGDSARVKPLLRSVASWPAGAVSLADQLIRPVMERLGDHWQTGVIDIYHEHQATQILTTLLAEMPRRTMSPGAPLALGATPESDPYLLPLQLGALVLQENGWNVRNLGVNLPLRSLTAAVAEYRPRLVFLSISSLADGERFAHEYNDFYESVASMDVAIMLGGRALSPELRTRLVYASFGERMAHLAEFARRIITPLRAASTLLSSG